MEQIWKYDQNGGILVKKGDASLAAIKKVTTQFPNFPFGFYAATVAFIILRDSTWEGYARRCIEILKVTTSIENHHVHHDMVFERIKVLVKERGKSW